MEKSETSAKKSVGEVFKAHAVWGFVLIVVSFIFIVWNLLANAWLVPFYNDSIYVAVDVRNNLEKSYDLVYDYNLITEDTGNKSTCYNSVKMFNQNLDSSVKEYKKLYESYVSLYSRYEKNDTLPEDEKVSTDDLDTQIKKMLTSYTTCAELQTKLYARINITPELLQYTVEYLQNEITVNNFGMVNDGIYDKVFNDVGLDLLDYWQVIEEYNENLINYINADKPGISFTYNEYEDVLNLSADNLFASEVTEFSTRFTNIVDKLQNYSSVLSENSTNYILAVNYIDISTTILNSIFGVILLSYGIFMLVERKQNK